MPPLPLFETIKVDRFTNILMPLRLLSWSFSRCLTDSELELYQADAIFEDEIEVLPRRRPQVPTILFTFCDEPNHIKAEFLRGKTVLIDFIDVDDTPELRETVRRWMLEIPKSLPAAVVVSVMFKNKQLIAWKFDYESKKYKRFA